MLQTFDPPEAEQETLRENGSDCPPPAPTAIEQRRIVHVCRQYRPAVGGLERVVEALAQRQRQEGHQVSVVTLDRVFSKPATRLAPFEMIDGIRVHRMPYWGSRRYPVALGVLHHIREASIVHVHGIDFFFDFLALTKALHGRTLIATTHGGFFHTRFAAPLKRLWFAGITRWSANRYAAVVACSQQDYDRFGAIKHPTLVLAENGVELERLASPAGQHRQDEMIYFGRLSSNKDLFGLLAWFAAVSQQQPHWRLTIAGAPDGISVPDLADRVAVLKLVGKVRVVATPTDAKLATLIARASIFVSASRYEGFGLAPIEAVAAGLLPVLRNIAPFERIVERTGTGVLTDFAPDEDGVKRTLAAIAEQRRVKPASNALDSYSWAAAAGAYERIYDHCLGAAVRRIGRVAIEVTDQEAVIAKFDRCLSERKRLTIAFCNAHTVNMAESNDEMARALETALVLNDGVGVDLASRKLFGRTFPQNLNGTDLTPTLMEQTTHSLRVFLIGAAPGVAEEAAIALAAAYPRHRVVGTQHGYFTQEDEDVLLERIKAARPDLILLGMGHPRQEIWAAKHRARLPGVTMCVGAYIDRAAGRVKRAPEWARSFRAEWLYRLLREPRRLAGRYLIGNTTFMARVLRQHGNGALELSQVGAPR